jgi:hypothetical protein
MVDYAEEWYRTHPAEVAATVVPYAVFIAQHKARLAGLPGKLVAAQAIVPRITRPRARQVTTILKQNIPVKTERRPDSNRLTLPFERVVDRRRREVAERREARERKVTRSQRIKKEPLVGVEYFRRDPCSYCGGKANQLDHIEPVYYGGAHDAGNITATCWRCNKEKATRSLVVFLARRAQRRAA